MARRIVLSACLLSALSVLSVPAASAAPHSPNPPKTSASAPAARAGHGTPDLTGFPNRASTGVPRRVKLKDIPGDVRRGRGWHWDPRGWVDITGDNAVFEGYRIKDGGVDVFADNVRIRFNDIQQSGEGWVVGFRPGSAHVLVAHNTFHGPCLHCANRLTYGINGGLGGNTSHDRILDNEFYDIDHPLQVDSGLVAGNLVHRMATLPSGTDHVDCFFSGGGGRGRLTIRHNTLLNDNTGGGSTASIMLNNAFGAQRNRIIEDNLIAGGAYSLYGGNSGPGASNVVIRDNRFSTAYFRKGGYYGPIAYIGSRRDHNMFSNNRWADGPHRGRLIRP